MWLLDLFFPQFYKPDMLRYGYLYFGESLWLRDKVSQLYNIYKVSVSYKRWEGGGGAGGGGGGAVGGERRCDWS